jgi:hypothetical protein
VEARCAEPGLPAAAHTRRALSRRNCIGQRALRKTYGKPFDKITETQRQEFLVALSAGKVTFENGPPARVFFGTLYQNVIEGMFSDPIHGGNPTGPVGALTYWAADAIRNRYIKNPGPLVSA